jgi:hypothetical protein
LLVAEKRAALVRLRTLLRQRRPRHPAPWRGGWGKAEDGGQHDHYAGEEGAVVGHAELCELVEIDTA